MSNRWPGGLIRKTPVTPNGPGQNKAASGVWSLADAAYWTKQGLWPTAGVIIDATFTIFAFGIASSVSATREKYTYSGGVNSVGGSATIASYRGSAAGTDVVGIFALGNGCSSGIVATRNKYTYSGCVVGAATAASAATYAGSAVGNNTVGIFSLGLNSGGSRLNTRDKYTYA
jgi:hypothetical protein